MEVNELNIHGEPQKAEAEWVLNHLDGAASFIMAVNERDSHFLNPIHYSSNCGNTYELIPGWIEGDEVIYYTLSINGQSIMDRYIVANYCLPCHARWHKFDCKRLENMFGNISGRDLPINEN